jgi:hypothetical protein
MAIPETTRKIGEVVTDFANAKDTDEACLKHFGNIQHVLTFSPDFVQRIGDVFPWTAPFTSLSAGERELMELIYSEQMTKHEINKWLGVLCLRLEDCDPEQDTLLIEQYRFEGGMSEGEPDIDVRVDGQFSYRIDEFKAEFQDEIGSGLRPDTFDGINALMDIARRIEEMTAALTSDRVKELYGLASMYHLVMMHHDQMVKIQDEFRGVLELISQGKPYHEIPSLPRLVGIYNGLPKSKMVLSEEDSFIEAAPINENDYFKIEGLHDWLKRIGADLTYCLVEFVRGEDSRRYMKKCYECQEYFISRTKREQKFCSGKCRSKHYHSKPEYKEKKAKERREMFGWKKKSERKK